MDNDNGNAFFKQKGFYISLLVGVVALLAVGIISTGVFNGEENNQQIADNSDTSAELADEEMPIKKADGDNQAETELTENTGIETAKEKKETGKEKTAKAEDVQKTADADTKEQEAKQPAAPEPEVAQTSTSTAKNLSFDEEKGLLWPISGDVLLPYSMDKSIYFKTLAQYKCNPAMMIAGKEGMDVVASYSGVITDITEEAETGITITTSVGNDYEVIYGNLKDVAYNIGDSIEEGAVLGKLAKPTKYYVEEGTGLYFQVMEKDETVDPMLLLR